VLCWDLEGVSDEREGGWTWWEMGGGWAARGEEDGEEDGGGEEGEEGGEEGQGHGWKMEDGIGGKD